MRTLEDDGYWQASMQRLNNALDVLGGDDLGSVWGLPPTCFRHPVGIIDVGLQALTCILWSPRSAHHCKNCRRFHALSIIRV